MARTRHLTRLLIEDLERRDVPAGAIPDPTFGDNGLATISVPQAGAVQFPVATAFASVVQPDGKIVVVGTFGPQDGGPDQYLSGSPSPDFGAIRLNVNGSLDTTFGVNGRARIPFDINKTATPAVDLEDHAFNVGLQSNGDIVITGSAIDATAPYGVLATGTSPTDGDDWAATRLTPGGVLDKTFGTNGLEIFPFGGVTGTAPTDMVVTANDKIVMVGREDVNNGLAGGDKFEVARLLPDGPLDPTFNFGNGTNVFTLPVNLVSNPTGLPSPKDFHIAVAPDQSIFLAGEFPGVGNDFTIAKIDSTGEALNPSFGVVDPLPAPGTGLPSGFAFAGLKNATVSDIIVDPSGNIIVTGTTSKGNFTTVRFTPKGVLDPTFGTAGVSTVAFDLGGTEVDTPGGIAIQPDGKIVIDGVAQTGGTSGGNATPIGDQGVYNYALTRLNADGTIDTTFATSGKATYVIPNPPGNGAAQLTVKSLVFSTGGKIDIVGYDSSRINVLQVTNTVTFNPLPPASAPVPFPQTIASPGTNIGTLAAGTDNGQLVSYQPPVPQDYLYDTTQQSNLAQQGPMMMFTSGFTGEIRTAVADVNGDGIPDTVVATGPGTPTRWAVISGAFPYNFIVSPLPAFQGDDSFSGGAFVSSADMDGDGRAEIVVSADVGGGPRISIYSYVPSTTPPSVKVDADFYGIADSNFRGGTRTAIGDINGDQVPDLVVAAGIGGGPRIAVFDGYGLFKVQNKLVNDFFAFGSTLRDGSYVAVGDVNGDGFGDIVFGAGGGGAPQVLIVSGQKLLENTVTAISTPIDTWFVNGDSTSRGGVRVAVKNVDGDNKADIVTGSGFGQPSLIRVYKGANVTKGEPQGYQDLTPFFGGLLSDGIFVG